MQMQILRFQKLTTSYQTFLKTHKGEAFVHINTYKVHSHSFKSEFFYPASEIQNTIHAYTRLHEDLSGYV
jgi:hypothetical protein